jgi:uncharacterized membrane protein
MIDLYTKLVLTVIAAALLVLAGDYMLSPASAQSTSCGTPKNPCFVAIGYLNSNDEYVVCYSTAPCAKK